MRRLFALKVNFILQVLNSDLLLLICSAGNRHIKEKQTKKKSGLSQTIKTDINNNSNNGKY